MRWNSPWRRAAASARLRTRKTQDNKLHLMGCERSFGERVLWKGMAVHDQTFVKGSEKCKVRGELVMPDEMARRRRDPAELHVQLLEDICPARKDLWIHENSASRPSLPPRLPGFRSQDRAPR